MQVPNALAKRSRLIGIVRHAVVQRSRTETVRHFPRGVARNAIDSPMSSTTTPVSATTKEEDYDENNQ